MLAHPSAQALEDVAHERIAVAREPIMHPFPVALDVHQTGPTELGEMPGHFRLIESQSAMEVANADLALGQKIQQAQPGGIRQRLKEQCGLDRIWFLHELTYTP